MRMPRAIPLLTASAMGALVACEEIQREEQPPPANSTANRTAPGERPAWLANQIPATPIPAPTPTPAPSPDWFKQRVEAGTTRLGTPKLQTPASGGLQGSSGLDQPAGK